MDRQVSKMNTFNAEQQINERQELIKKIFVARFILDSYGSLNIDSTEDPTQIKRAQQYAQIAEYINLGGNADANCCLLNLKESIELNLSYTERKTICESLVKHLRKNLQHLSDFDLEIHKKNKDLMSNIISLEAKRQGNYQEIANLRAKKCSLLKQVAEIKLDPTIIKEIELLLGEGRLLKVKGSLLHSIMTQHLATRTEYAIKAMKEIVETIEVQNEID